MTSGSIDRLNGLTDGDAAEAFKQCCGAKAWYSTMAGRRPFDSQAHLVRVADQVFNAMVESDWLEAFACHPKIGDLDSIRMKYAGNKQWSAGEQAGVSQADDDVIRDLADGNRVYEERFGFIFIVCASGKSAAEMLKLLRARLPNDRTAEIRIAAEEQKKITRLRITKLLHHPTN